MTSSDGSSRSAAGDEGDEGDEELDDDAYDKEEEEEFARPRGRRHGGFEEPIDDDGDVR